MAFMFEIFKAVARRDRWFLAAVAVGTILATTVIVADASARILPLGAAYHRTIVKTGDACEAEAAKYVLDLGKIGRCHTIWAGNCKYRILAATKGKCDAEFTVTVDGKAYYRFCNKRFYWQIKKGVIFQYKKVRWNCDWVRHGEGPPT